MTSVRESKDIADTYGLQLVAYEGGSGLISSDRSLQELLTAAEFDPLMADLYVDYFRAWQAVGGGLFNHYAFLGGGIMTPWGDWGSLPSSLDHGSFKWDGMMRYRFQPGDLDGDGAVTYADFCVLRDHCGQGKPFVWDRAGWGAELGRQARDAALRQACWWMDGDVQWRQRRRSGRLRADEVPPPCRA